MAWKDPKTADVVAAQDAARIAALTAQRDELLEALRAQITATIDGEMCFCSAGWRDRADAEGEALVHLSSCQQARAAIKKAEEGR